MISTKNYHLLPDQKSLQRICKAISVLDAILSQDWVGCYYSYNSQWSEQEECFEMRNGEGDHMLILFCKEGCVINGFAHKYEQPDKAKLTTGLPTAFQEFMFGEPIQSMGTTFCLWKLGEANWQVGQLSDFDDSSDEMLALFDGKPQTYIAWATEYFEGSYKEEGIPIKVVSKIYNGETLTKKMVLSIVDEIEDWEQLRNDLEEIDYPYKFS